MTGSWLGRHLRALLAGARFAGVFVIGVGVGIGLTPYIQGYRGPLPWDGVFYLLLACAALWFSVFIERYLPGGANESVATRSG